MIVTTTEEEFKEYADMNLHYFEFSQKEKYFLACNKKNFRYLEPRICINYEYITPSGRGRYSDTESKSIDEFEALLKRIEIERIEQNAMLKQIEAEKLRKRERMQKLNGLELFERNLKKREIKIKEEEEEFKVATHGHIYSKDQIIQNKDENIDAHEETDFQKLKKLKSKMETGEITIQEYSIEREKLL